MKFEFKVRVYYEDTDFAGIVYHANYLKYIERARTNLLLSLGISQSKINLKKNGYFVVKKIDADFLAPSFFEDELIVISNFIKVKFTCFEMQQDIFRGSDKIFKSKILLAYLESGKLSKIPQILNNIKN